MHNHSSTAQVLLREITKCTSMHLNELAQPKQLPFSCSIPVKLMTSSTQHLAKPKDNIDTLLKSSSSIRTDFIIGRQVLWDRNSLHNPKLSLRVFVSDDKHATKTYHLFSNSLSGKEICNTPTCCSAKQFALQFAKYDEKLWSYGGYIAKPCVDYPPQFNYSSLTLGGHMADTTTPCVRTTWCLCWTPRSWPELNSQYLSTRMWFNRAMPVNYVTPLVPFVKSSHKT